MANQHFFQCGPTSRIDFGHISLYFNTKKLHASWIHHNLLGLTISKSDESLVRTHHEKFLVSHSVKEYYIFVIFLQKMFGLVKVHSVLKKVDHYLTRCPEKTEKPLERLQYPCFERPIQFKCNCVFSLSQLSSTDCKFLNFPYCQRSFITFR